MSVEYDQFVSDVGGNNIPVNEATQLLAEHWMMLAVAMANSQSAALGGSLIQPDYERAKNEIAVITQLVDEMESRVKIDLPETAKPGAGLGPASVNRAK